ncbi:hypothetical protein SAMN05421736_101330 [Evansella caseinilytica]|uniref:Protein required for attachment to host cells n=1 Tax=Evansella caseinilytica TaxID=1503961 RepID=A0A1H3H008_9BACI|nr:VLRF1 family aeRF1-type release factor [Evansella caseinilytica]SDY08670.1 hypothetical protein SAMN05421736_101330 [Evansella caseinilytica]
MTLLNDLRELKNFQCQEGKCVLSLYLNTDRADQDQQKGEWKIRLKNGLKRLEQYLTVAGKETELKSYKRLRKKVEKEIVGNQPLLQKSVIIFASDVQNLWSVHYLNIPVETSFHWEKNPVLDQIIRLNEKYPKSGIILPNLDEIKIYETDLGEIVDTKVFCFDPEAEDWRLKQGASSSERTASSAMHVDDYQRRFAENLQRFYRKVAVTIEKMKDENQWEALYLIGDAECTRSLQSLLRIKIDGAVYKNLNNFDSSKVLEQVYH